MNFGSLGIHSQETKYLNIENTGEFPLHYSIRKRKEYLGNPSGHRVSSTRIKDAVSKDFENITDISIRKDKTVDKIMDKKLAQIEKSSIT